MPVRVSKFKLWKAIRANCLDCVGTSYAIKDCMGYDCKLYPYRFGKASLETDLALEPDLEQEDTRLPASDSPSKDERTGHKGTPAHWRAKKKDLT